MANIIKTTLEDANDVLTYSNKASFPSSGENGKLYIAADTKYTYFWNGSSYIETRGSGYAASSHTHEVSDITDIYKQEYNLGYYDTITANADGTYTITRQTGYVDIDNETLTYFSDNNRPRWLICNLSDKAVIPSVNTELGQIITGNYETKTEANAWNTNSGMSLNTSGEVVIYGATRPTGIIQYKLATPYTEKVEKNHYATYNQNFILEHNKSEAERSANLFDVNNVEYGSISENGEDLWNGYARARSFYIPVLANTYYSISTNNSELLIYELYQYDSNKSHIEPYTSILNNTFTFLTRNNTYYIRILFRNTSNTDFNLDILSSVMLNKDSVALPYQPYEGKVVHEKGLEVILTNEIPTKISQLTNDSGFLTSHLYRPIQVDGTQILANNSSTALNLKTGNNIRITNSNGTVTIDAANTTYSAGTGLSLSGNTFSVKTGYTTDANNRNYKVAADSSGNLYVNVPWSSSGTLDTSLNSSSTNALQNKAVYSAFSSAVGYDNNYYAYGEKGSWRIHQYNKTGNNLDIRYGVIAVNSQSANYSVSFSKNFTNTQYTVVFGLYRSNTQSWFWSPIVQSKTTSGFTVFLRGNSGGDNGGTIMYLAIRSN